MRHSPLVYWMSAMAPASAGPALRVRTFGAFQPLPLPDETLDDIAAALVEASEEFIP